MTEFQIPIQNPISTEGPACDKCGKPMVLARIEPEAPGFDRRTFECPECTRSEVRVVKFD